VKMWMLCRPQGAKMLFVKWLRGVSLRFTPSLWCVAHKGLIPVHYPVYEGFRFASYPRYDMSPCGLIGISESGIDEFIKVRDA